MKLPDLFFPLIRAILEGNKGTLRGLLLCCSVANIKRMWGFNTSICFALSLSMFASLGEWNMFADNTFFPQAQVFVYLLGLTVCEEEGNKSTQGDLLFLLRDPLNVSKCGSWRHKLKWFCNKVILKKKVREHKMVAKKTNNKTTVTLNLCSLVLAWLSLWIWGLVSALLLIMYWPLLAPCTVFYLRHSSSVDIFGPPTNKQWQRLTLHCVYVCVCACMHVHVFLCFVLWSRQSLLGSVWTA